LFEKNIHRKGVALWHPAIAALAHPCASREDAKDAKKKLM
jgi:hypothetical protein